MASAALHPSLLDLIRSGQTSTEIVLSFNRIYSNASRTQYKCAGLLLLFTAEEHNCTDLARDMRVLLSHPNSGLRTEKDKFLVAISLGNRAFVESFMRGSLSVYLVGLDKETFSSAINNACKHDHVEILKVLLNSSVIQLYAPVQTPLHYACEHGANNCVDYLLTTRAGRSSVNVFKHNSSLARFYTPLMLGLKHGPEIVAKLLKAGARATLITRADGMTMIHLVIESVAKEESERMKRPAEVVRLLLDAGADVNQCSGNGTTLLTLLVRQLNTSMLLDAHMHTKLTSRIVDIMWVLLTASPHVNCRNRQELMVCLLSFSENMFFLAHYPRLPYNMFYHDSDSWSTPFTLAAQLLQLMITNDADQLMNDEHMSSTYYRHVMKRHETCNVIFLAKQLIKNRGLLGQMFNDNGLLFETTMNSMCDVLRCLLLTGDRVYPDRQFKDIVESLVDTKSEASIRFVRLLFTTRNQTELNSLISVWNSNEATMKWIEGLEDRLTLKHLARRAIVSALGRRTLNGAFQLGLPMTPHGMLSFLGYILYLV